jgi:branched-chain amino acid transport system permease protein
MATIAAAELFRILAANWGLLGAAVGLMGPPVPRTVCDLSFISPVLYHYLFLAVSPASNPGAWRRSGRR